MWGQAGGRADSTFNQAFVQISDARYFYNGFAFRFRTFGRRSGPFDTWHVDYIYLNKGRSATDKYMIDIATQRALSPLLKRYTAMPMSQYKLKGAAELADSVNTIVKNLINNPTPVPSRFSVRDEVSGRSLQNEVTDPIYVNGSQRRSVKTSAYTFDNSTSRALLRYELDLQTSDNQNAIFQRDPQTLLRNDTISAVAALDNYYAYDDGSWEYAQQIRQREQIAVRFILNRPDTVGSVRACIVPFTTNQAGQPFVITVYANLNGKPGTALYQQSFPMQYPDTRNGFVDYKFTRSVIVKDTFYVGYQQISSSDTTFLRLGFDKNSPFGENIFYNGGTNWEQNLQRGAQGSTTSLLQVQGAFMLRPVMGGKLAVVTATEEPEPLVPLRTYPNPTSGLIHWDDPRLTRLEVISNTGRLLHALEPERGQQTLDLSYLPDGLYLIRLFAKQQTTVQKLIIQH
ncbi:T9SS type A sorting domain-containing protein [Spirosoma telluris]|uniref:T9SS type A sorting domain-containing protein n=1 Tax=Spirosoma telluris TaxID=2183553 RepID=UPI002FC2947B